jgi:hypothetical protein
MTLAELVRALSALGASVSGDAATRVVGVRQDSRQVQPGELFVARAGATLDGARFAADAVRRGGAAVLCDQGATLGELSVPVVRVNDVVRALGLAAEAVYGSPSQKLSLVGITGTNGKTTTACLVQQALLALIVTPEQRPAVSAYTRAALNLGAALGGVIGGFLVHANTLGAFRWLFAVNVATYVIFLAVLPGMPSGKVVRAAGAAHHGGFRRVLGDEFFVRLLATDIAIGLGFGFLFAFMPAYASSLGIDKTTIGVLFTFGAASVVLTQIPTLRWVRGRARMRWGEHLEFTAEAGPGDFIYVPPYVPHQEINASPTEALECVLCRSDGEAVAVNLAIEPVEKPEQVLWIDPTHPMGGV